jgi:hypothetical protein
MTSNNLPCRTKLSAWYLHGKGGKWHSLIDKLHPEDTLRAVF